MSDDTHVYIGTLPCGCHVAAVVDSVDRVKETALSVSKMIRQGYAISRHTLIDIRSGKVNIASCCHEKKTSGELFEDHVPGTGGIDE